MNKTFKSLVPFALVAAALSAGAQDFPAPAYTIYNAALFYRWEKIQFSLKVENLTDKTYSRSVLGAEGHFPGTPRSYTFSALYRF